MSLTHEVSLDASFVVGNEESMRASKQSPGKKKKIRLENLRTLSFRAEFCFFPDMYKGDT